MNLVAHNLTKSFGPRVRVLSGVSLSLKKGHSIAICGRSGEGKTTLLHILGTLEKSDSGTLEIAGDPVSSTNAARLRLHHIGFIFQSYNLLEDFTALENVLMPAQIARTPLSLEKGLALLKRVSLLERAHFPVKLLSGGERQRVTIARALCNDPDFILADEPTGNLDQANAEEVMRLLLSSVHKEKKGLILVTHDLQLASLCDEQLLLRSGQLFRT